MKKSFEIKNKKIVWVSTKNFSPFGPAVWPARGNILNVLFYYIDIPIRLKIIFTGMRGERQGRGGGIRDLVNALLHIVSLTHICPDTTQFNSGMNII